MIEWRFSRYPLFWATVALAGLALALLTPVDYELTVHLSAYDIELFNSFMNESLFEGDRLGAGDISTIFQIAVLFFYLYAWLNPRGSSRIVKWRPQLGLIVAVSLIYNVFLVHGLKFVVGRARPELVLEGGARFSNWFEFGAHFLALEGSVGSLPSGHTASALIFLTLAYCMAGDSSHSRLIRRAGWLLGGAALLYAGFMATVRCLTLYHWPTDCLISVILGCLVIHFLYFWVLRIPEQSAYQRTHDAPPPLPKIWELRLCWRLFVVSAGLVAAISGARGVFLEGAPELTLLLVPGIFLALALFRSPLAIRPGCLVPEETATTP